MSGSNSFVMVLPYRRESMELPFIPSLAAMGCTCLAQSSGCLVCGGAPRASVIRPHDVRESSYVACTGRTWWVSGRYCTGWSISPDVKDVACGDVTCTKKDGVS